MTDLKDFRFELESHRKDELILIQNTDDPRIVYKIPQSKETTEKIPLYIDYRGKSLFIYAQILPKFIVVWDFNNLDALYKFYVGTSYAYTKDSTEYCCHCAEELSYEIAFISIHELVRRVLNDQAGFNFQVLKDNNFKKV